MTTGIRKTISAWDADRRLMSISYAASELGVARGHLQKAVKNGDLRACRLGERTVRVSWSDINRWLQKIRVPSCTEARNRASEIVEAVKLDVESTRGNR